ncbi:MAG TPA: bifunctional adenosylcobinamide kinase/adenosylcobinamide-phosphate guanylyltransferase [Bacillota bacterium]|nr:bifunctional adenosylcobinamide kinase/adenosylcobinamide-phosphate guanylyltransferase [Bacillota bacterium]
MNIFISGGCKNGKSYYAQQLAKQQAEGGRPLYYLATMEPVDEEDRARILRHRQEREGWGFTTLEWSRGIGALDADFSGSILLDSVTALLSNEMFASAQRDDSSAPSGRQDGSAGFEVDRTAYLRVAEELVTLAEKSGNVVFVSDYIYSDAVQYDELTELYRKGLAWIDRALAQKCDAVIEVAYGHIQRIK